MNVSELSESLGLDETELLEIIEIFVDANRADISELVAAIEESNGRKVAEAAHSIKGASANLGLAEIHETAKKLEEKGLSNCFAGATELVQTLAEKTDEICKLTLSQRAG